MKSTKGFTLIELLIVIAVIGAASIIFFIQKSQVETTARDDTRKTAINAIYYSLEEVYYKEHGAYPRKITEKTIPSVDPALLKDPQGVLIGEGASQYRYEGTDCSADTCKKYTLRASLENEDDYVKTNRNN